MSERPKLAKTRGNMRTLVIDRSTWLRGEGDDHSYLYRPSDGRKCCLGFAGEQLCGLTAEQMSERGTPYVGVKDAVTLAFLEHLPWLLVVRNPREEGGIHTSGVCGELMEQNDLASIETYDDYGNIEDIRPVSDSEREAFIVKKFAEHDIDVRFVDSAEASCPNAA